MTRNDRAPPVAEPALGELVEPRIPVSPAQPETPGTHLPAVHDGPFVIRAKQPVPGRPQPIGQKTHPPATLAAPLLGSTEGSHSTRTACIDCDEYVLGKHAINLRVAAHIP